MASFELVHWREGMYLEAHHLQVMQRRLLDRMDSDRMLAWSFPYGVIEADLSYEALATGRVEFARLRVILRSGREVRVPGNADLQPLDIKAALDAADGSLLISLAVPVWQERRPNSCENDGQPRRPDALYQPLDAEMHDENTGANPRPVSIRRINARLVAGEVEGEFETMPLLRVKRAAGAAVGRPIPDENFIPPCLVLDGSRDLRRIVKAIADKIVASRAELVPQLRAAGFNLKLVQPAQIGLLLRLRVLNRFAARLPALVATAGIPPFLFYLELRDLLAELLALHPESDGLFDVPQYRHDDPAPVFLDLERRIDPIIADTVPEPIWAARFAEEEGLLVARLTEQQLKEPNAYYLGVVAQGDPAALSELVQHQDNFKLIAHAWKNRLVRGVRLIEERNLPPGLLRQGGVIYYRLDRTGDSEQRWNAIVNDPNRAVAIVKPADKFPDAVFTLYMTIPQPR